MQNLIEVVDNNFQITIKEKLPNSVQMQIKFFGFSAVPNKDKIFLGNLEKINIIEIVDFFEQNNIKINICDKTKKTIDHIKLSHKNFGEKIRLLSEIKNNFNTDDFNLFSLLVDNLKRKLKEHQKKSAYHLYKAECAANFSVPGSGKTSVVLAVYEILKNKNEVNGLFVIGPTNCYYSWLTEFKETIGRDPNFIIWKEEKANVRLNSLNSELILSHFQSVANDIDLLKKFFFHNKFMLVVDEAHNIKREDGVWSSAVLELSKLSKYKVILTGTPMPNHLKDFYNYLDFLYNNDEIISSNEKAKIENYLERDEKDNAIEILNKRIFPFFTIVTKKNLNLSKPVFNKPYLIKMNPIENEIYNAIISKIKHYAQYKYLKEIDLIEKIIKARVLRLRQTCSYVKNLNSAIEDNIKEGDEKLADDSHIKNLINNYDLNEKPAKLEALRSLTFNLLKKYNKILIWSTHLLTIDLIQNEFLSHKINIKKITGATDFRERENIKNEFNDLNSLLQIIVANPQACAESISLHKVCQNAIYYDLNYNTAEFLQSLDRIHRVGGSEIKPAFYHFLQYENSIEQKVYERVFYKADQQMKVIDSDNLTFSNQEDEEDQDFRELYKDFNL